MTAKEDNVIFTTVVALILVGVVIYGIVQSVRAKKATSVGAKASLGAQAAVMFSCALVSMMLVYFGVQEMRGKV